MRQQQQPQSNNEHLFQLVSYADVKGIKSRCHEGAKLELIDGEGRTPLILACENSESNDVAKTLLELGSDPNACGSGCNGGTPLHHAATRGHENMVKLLLSHGANPMVLNDDSQTPLEIARAIGHPNIVRTIESHICLFSGWMRESYGPSFVEIFAPQLLTRKLWVVIVPTGSRDPTKPLKLELAVYSSLQDAKPRTVVALWKANMEEPKSDQSEASVMIFDNSTSARRKRERRKTYISQGRRWVQVDRRLCLKLAAATKGDVKQLKWFCEACKGVPQPMAPPMFLQSSQTKTSASQDHASMANVDFIYQDLTPSVFPIRAETEVEGSPRNYESVDSNLVNISLPSADRECVICVDASSEAVCVPCGHVAGCITCLKKIKDNNLGCPVCRANINQVIKLYHV